VTGTERSGDRHGPPTTVETVLAVWRMARPSQLLLIVAVYALGVAIAVGLGTALEPRAVLFGLLALLPVAASVHFANEFADYETDRLTSERGSRTPFSGGSGAADSVPRSVARRATLVAGVVGALVSLGLVLAGRLSPSAFCFLAAIGLLGWVYSLRPVALSRRGLGEVDNALLGGLLLPLYGAATLEPPSVAVGLAVVPFTLLVFANLLATQWPDRGVDAATGKYTLPTRWSTRRLRRVHLAAVVAAFTSLVALTGSVLPPVVTVASLVAVPFAGWGVATFTRDERPFPTVAAMVVMAVAQLVAWAAVADLLPAPGLG
jgi:1,4-dihydroxy-2-naphthoate octaprenyltransferase